MNTSGGSIVKDGAPDGIWIISISTANQFPWNPNFDVSAERPRTPLELAVYTPEEWRIIQSLGLTFLTAQTASY